jgi:hypothetical protein
VERGEPISYQVLRPGTPVLATGGETVGEVKEVLSSPEEDIFEGLILKTEHGDRFAYAELIDSIYTHAVMLNCDAASAGELPAPEPAPAVLEVGPDDVAEPKGRYGRDNFFRRIWNRLSGNY